MIELFLVDWLFNRITIFPTFLFLLGLIHSSYLNVLITSIVLDIWLRKLPFNLITLNLLYLINHKYLKRNKRFKNYYLVNLFNLVIYYSIGYIIYSHNFERYLISIGLIIILNSIFWLGSYSLENNS